MKKEREETIQLFGLEPEMSLQNVNFAASENSYLNIYQQIDEEEEYSSEPRKS